MYHYIWAAWDTYCTREKFPKSLQPQPGLFFPTKWLVAAEVPKENITHLNLPSDSYHNPYIVVIFIFCFILFFCSTISNVSYILAAYWEKKTNIVRNMIRGVSAFTIFKKISCDEYYYKDTINKQLLLGKLRQILWNQRAWWNWICDSSIQLSLWLQWRTKSSSVS